MDENVKDEIIITDAEVAETEEADEGSGLGVILAIAGVGAVVGTVVYEKALKPLGKVIKQKWDDHKAKKQLETTATSEAINVEYEEAEENE